MTQTNYRNLAEQVRLKQNPDNIAFTKAFSDELASVSYSDVLYYVKIAMNAVEPSYTARSKEAGENVKNHLLSGGLTDVTFRYQGSVMTDTHVKGHSDIDLLAISDKFYSRALFDVVSILNDPSRKQNYYPSQISKMEVEKSLPVYVGVSLDDLRKLRLNSEYILSSVYTYCETGKPKSIKVNNTNLRREVDVVIANWYDDIRSIVNDKGEHRGIQIYNKDSHGVGSADFPFLSIERINQRSAQTNGRLKKMIRFLKNLKGKSSLDIGLNSFEFNAICYDIDKSKYESLAYYELVYIIYLQIRSICSSNLISDGLISVDGSEYVFRGKPERLQSLKNLLIEVESIYNDLKSSL
ncbi:MAG: hypothetical protein V4663_14600 [Bacteroidota bacterium]